MRAKLKPTAPKTRDEMESLVGEITALKIQERKIKAEMDAVLKQTKDNYQALLTKCNEQLAARLPRALAWAEANAHEFGTSKSLELLHATIGWRITPPSLKTLAGWTWDRVIEKIHDLGLDALYLRVKQEVNKQAILAERDAIGTDQLRSFGVRVVQEEEFYVEPKLTDAPAREVVNA